MCKTGESCQINKKVALFYDYAKVLPDDGDENLVCTCPIKAEYRTDKKGLFGRSLYYGGRFCEHCKNPMI